MTKFSIETFQNALNKGCSLYLLEGPALSIELIEVKILHESEDAASRQFSVLWRGPSTPVLAQAIYTIELPNQETHEFFLVPVGADGEGILYEAVFA